MPLTCLMAAAALVASVQAAATGSPDPGGRALGASGPALGLYREPFEQGLAALEAGQAEEAARYFRAAGEFAPDAPVWKAYLAQASGEQAAVTPERLPDERGPWELAPATRAEPRFDPTGERLLSGHDPVSLWDARSGERIAVLTHRGAERARRWTFDATGRLVVGMGWGPGSHVVSRGLDVRDARTGDAIEVQGSSSLALRWGTRFEWAPKGTRIEHKTRRRTFHVSLPDGVLLCSTPSTRENEDFVPGPHGERAVYLHRAVPSELRLVDPRNDTVVAAVSDGGWRALFSESGRFVASLDQSRVLLLDAESGKRLTDAPAPARRDPGDLRYWSCAFDADLLVIADRTGQVVWWDPPSAREVRRVMLDPIPTPGVFGIALAAGGARLIVNGYNSLHGYDTASGVRVWSDEGGRLDLDGALASDGLRVATGDVGATARILDVRTGETIVPLRSEPLVLQDIEVLEGTHACVLRVSDGSLRRVDLATGATEALAMEPSGSGSSSMWSIDQERLLTWTGGQEVSWRDATTLAPVSSIALEREEQVLAVARDGSRVATRRPEGHVRVRSLSTGTDPIHVEAPAEQPRSASFSADGSRLALVFEDAAWILDAATGARVSDFPLSDAPDPGPVAFYGQDRLAVGWGDEEEVGVDVLRLPEGQRIARLEPSAWLGFGGNVGDLRCHPESGLLIYSVSSSGFVSAFRDDGWKESWTIDYRGGNPAPLRLQKPTGSARLHVSGMTIRHARIVDLVSGKVLAKEPVEGLFDLDGTSDDRFFVGSNDGLVVHSGESFDRLYTRSDGSGGSAWISRQGEDLQILDDGAWASGRRHLLRDGTSRTVDCWDAWLRDPLALCPAALALLPEPPRIASGPPRVLSAEGDTVELEVEVVCEEPLLGVQVEIAGRAPRLEPLAVVRDQAPSRATLRIDGPWPVDVRVRALARSGVLSAPWRIHVERAR